MLTDMRPRSKEERRALELSKALPNIELEETFHYDLDYKIEEVMDYMCYNSSFYANGHWIKPNWEEVIYMAQLVKVEDYQVVRYYTFDCSQHYVGGYLRYKDGEVAQRWFKDGKQVAFIARKAHNNHEHWCLRTEMSIRKNWDFGELEILTIESMHDKAFAWEAVRDSVSAVVQRSKFGVSEPFLFTPLGEFLYKCEPTLFRYAEENGIDNISPFEQSIRIAHRHHYKIDDIGIYLDYLRQLNTLGRDMCSPHYICPANLMAAHDKTTREMDVYNRRMFAENERKRIEKDKNLSEEYIARMGKYFNLCFKASNLSIEPLKSIEDFFAEGKAMHHCVYQCGYYKKEKNCLILSAKDNEGNRVETIEVGLDNFTIKQSRGACNQATKQHDDIINLVNAHMDEIRAIAKGRTKDNPKPRKKTSIKATRAVFA